MKPINFDIAVIARNEAKTLPRLVASCKEFMDRGGNFYVLDTGSTDGTADIARKLGCKVTEVGDRFRTTLDQEKCLCINDEFVRRLEDVLVQEGDTLFDFAAARNFVASLTEKKFVAMPDCDEIYTTFDIDKIVQTIEDGAEQLEYNFVYAHDAEGRPTIKFMHSKFYNKNKLSWRGVVHEILAGDAKRVFLGEDIILLEHYQNHETNRGGYLKGLALDCYEHPENDRNSHYLAREMFYTGRFHSAISEFERHLTLNGWSTERSESMNFIAKCYLALGEREEAVGWFARAFDMEPRRREPLMYLADMYYQSGNFDHALSYAEAALAVEDVADFYANHRPFYEHVPHEILYWAYWKRGDYRKSKHHFEECLRYQPYNPKYLHDLRFYEELPTVSIILPTLGREEGLKRCLDSITALNYPKEKIDVKVLHDSFGEDRKGVPLLVKQGVEETKGEWIVFAANDIEFAPDALIIAISDGLREKKSLVSFNTGDFGEEKGNQCEHFAIRRDFLPHINGEIFDTEFYHAGCDTYLWAQAEARGEAMRSMRAIVTHHHFSRGNIEPDEVAKLAWKKDMVEKDRKLLKRKLTALARKAETV